MASSSNMASSSAGVKLKAKPNKCTSKAIDRVMTVFKSDNKMSSEEFIAFIRFENSMDRLLELQTCFSRALSFMVSHFGEDKALDIIRASSENCFLTRLLNGHTVCEFDFPEGDYTTKARDAKKVFDDFYGEARQLIMDVDKRFDINLVQKLGINKDGNSLLGEQFLAVEKFSKEAKDFEAALELDKAIPEPSYGPDVITLEQLYMEWVFNEEQKKYALPHP